MNLSRPGWVEYFFAGTMALVASWALAGCRFGNHSSTTIIRENQGLPTYYYGSELAAVTLCSIIDGTSDPICADAPLSMAPLWTQQLIQGIVGIQLEGVGGTPGVLFNPLNVSGNALATDFDPRTGTVAHQMQLDPANFWFTDGTCIDTYVLVQDGIASHDGGTVAGYSVSGRLAIDLTGLDQYSGTGCGPAFTAIAQCHADATQCGEPTPSENQQMHDEVESLLTPYLTTGALLEADISKVRGLGYNISFR